MEKIRRCREHVNVLRDGETCSFEKHSKNNKIEEMSEQEAEILDGVEMNTSVEQGKYETGEEALGIRSKKHYKTHKFYFKDVVFNPQVQNLHEVIGDEFRKIAQSIIEDIKGNVQAKDKGVFKKVVYEFCPNATCGKNPCSCGNNN